MHEPIPVATQHKDAPGKSLQVHAFNDGLLIECQVCSMLHTIALPAKLDSVSVTMDALSIKHRKCFADSPSNVLRGLM